MIIKRLNEDILKARKNRDTEVTKFLVTVKGELSRSDEKLEDMKDDKVLKIIKKMADNVKECISARYDEKLSKELKILENYLPVVMDNEAIEQAVKIAIEKTDAKSPADMGKVMAELKNYGASIDMKFASSKVKELLA